MAHTGQMSVSLNLVYLHSETYRNIPGLLRAVEEVIYSAVCSPLVLLLKEKGTQAAKSLFLIICQKLSASPSPTVKLLCDLRWNETPHLGPNQSFCSHQTTN